MRNEETMHKFVAVLNKKIETGKLMNALGHMTVGTFAEQKKERLKHQMAYVLALFIRLTGATTFLGGMQMGLWAWLGFIATTGLSNVLFEKRSPQLFMLNSGYYLVTLLIIGALLAIWA